LYDEFMGIDGGLPAKSEVLLNIDSGDGEGDISPEALSTPKMIARLRVMSKMTSEDLLQNKQELGGLLRDALAGQTIDGFYTNPDSNKRLKKIISRIQDTVMGQIPKEELPAELDAIWSNEKRRKRAKALSSALDEAMTAFPTSADFPDLNSDALMDIPPL